MIRPTHYPSKTRRAEQAPSPEAISAQMDFCRPVEPDLVLGHGPDEGEALNRDGAIKRILASRADWFCAASLLLDARGPNALSDDALARLVAVLDTLEGRDDELTDRR